MKKNKKIIATVVIGLLSVYAITICIIAAVTENEFFLKVTDIMNQISDGIWASLSIFAFTLLFSMPLALLVCFARRSRFTVVSLLTKFYISVMRGTPLMLQLIVVYFGPYYVFGVPLRDLNFFGIEYRFYATIIGFSLNYAAYFAEIYRSGIEAVPKGHYEAAKVLGYSRQQTFMKIVFPQMVRHIIPPVTNEIITLVKDTSLAFAIAYVEMFTRAKQVAAAQSSILALFVAGIFYYVFNLLVAFVMGLLEKKMNKYTV